jgi:hypothetical protein
MTYLMTLNEAVSVHPSLKRRLQQLGSEAEVCLHLSCMSQLDTLSY